MITVYDLDGVAHEKHPVDAKECIAILGWTTEPKAEDPPEDQPKKKDK